jgi:hypothetical protein
MGHVADLVAGLSDEISEEWKVTTHAGQTERDVLEPGIRAPHGAEPPATTALAIAAERWLRRGYRVEYQDGFLIQVARERRVVAGPGLLLAVASACLLGVGGLLALSAYLWRACQPRRHVVSLALTPQRHVITHVHWGL